MRTTSLTSRTLRVAAIPHAGSTIGRVTVSIGLAAMIPDSDRTAMDLIRAADHALYQAKNDGRNRSAVADVTR